MLIRLSALLLARRDEDLGCGVTIRMTPEGKRIHQWLEKERSAIVIKRVLDFIERLNRS